MKKGVALSRGVTLAICALVLTTVILVLTNLPPRMDPYAGFRLPEGDPEAGLNAFLEMRCNQCHAVEGTDIEGPAPDAPFSFTLGGPTIQARTYGMLLTAIMHPSHGIPHEDREEYLDASGEPLKLDFTEDMSVRQLIDIVEFLQQHYEIPMPEFPDYYRGYNYLPPYSAPMVP